jgi:Membrane dipeptidase (Peptidase family M19)
VRFKRVQFFVDEKFRNKKARIRIIDNDENGYISVDDFKFENTLSPQPNIRIAINPTDCPLKGLVDMHTHSMSHLAFGGKVMNGAPDEQTLMLPGTIYRGNDISNISNCQDSLRPGTIARALSRCDAIHGGPDANNNCGDIIRASALEKMDAINTHFGEKNDGYPDFKYWPSQQSILHQQMWHEWVRRAYNGGLRVMVSLSVNNSLLAKIVNGNMPQTDKESSDLQIKEMIAFVNRHSDFMEIARTPDDLKRIVGVNNKLAIILGIEVDDIGNFTYDYFLKSTRPPFTEPLPTLSAVKTELSRLYDQGIRYIFPIHLSNNVFGGTAINKNQFALISKFLTGQYINVENTNTEGVTVNLKKENYDFIDAAALRTRGVNYVIDYQPKYDTIPGYGHINALGLTDLGKSTLLEMMKMGFIVDIDHMGRKAMRDAIVISQNNRNYPLNTGHNEMMKPIGTERNLNLEIVRAVKASGGMIGLGTSDILPSDFAKHYSNMLSIMGNKNVAIGTDANGFEPLPKASPRLDSDIFYRDAGLVKQITGNRTWDYTKDGVAHYGLMPEFLFDIKRQSNGLNVTLGLEHSANDFLLMWQKTTTTAALIR